MGKAQDVDPVKRLADSLREKKGIPWRTAKLEVQEESQYVEFFRGKDFARHFRANPQAMAPVLGPIKPGKTEEDQIAELMQQLVKRKLVRKVDRKYKKPKPGRTRLVKFPNTLVPVQDQLWSETAFYVWLYDRPTSIWYYVGTVALPFVVILACLFPLAPWWVRMAVVYFLMAILSVLLGLISVRYLLFGFVWTLTGHSFWLFPNMMSDEVSIFDAFKPFISYKRPDKGKSQWLARLVTLLAVGSLVYLLYTHSPDADSLKENAKKAHESILDYLNVYDKGKAFLSGDVQAGATPGPGAQSSQPHS